MKHIVWDFNGTLLNDAQLSVDLDNYVFEQIGVPPITLEDYRSNMTMPVRDFYPLVGVDYDKHSYEEIARIWLDEFNRKAVGVGLLPGALDAIERCLVTRVRPGDRVAVAGRGDVRLVGFLDDGAGGLARDDRP